MCTALSDVNSNKSPPKDMHHCVHCPTVRTCDVALVDMRYEQASRLRRLVDVARVAKHSVVHVSSSWHSPPRRTLCLAVRWPRIVNVGVIQRGWRRNHCCVQQQRHGAGRALQRGRHHHSSRRWLQCACALRGAASPTATPEPTRTRSPHALSTVASSTPPRCPPCCPLTY